MNPNQNAAVSDTTPRTIIGFKLKRIASIAIAISVLCLACSKTANQEDVAVSPKGKATVKGPQPLPQGKKNFSVTMGNFDMTGRTWVRIINWTFNDSSGTIGATAWTWFSDVKTGHSPFSGGSHTCTMAGVTKTCNSDAPSGWSTSGTPIHTSWSGTYTYNTGTGQLVIDWNTIDGAATTATDSWTVTLPEPGIARVNLISSNYTLTHGRGYGSNASWSTFKTLSQIVNGGLPSYSGKNVKAYDSASAPLLIDPATPGVWKTSGAGFSLVGMTTPSYPSPAVTLHQWVDGNPCSATIANGGSCQTTRGGVVKHFTTTNTNRQCAYTIFCSCLTSTAAWPCYTANKHPHALMQIIDDSGNLKGFIGVESQNMYANEYQMHCEDFTNIP